MDKWYVVWCRTGRETETRGRIADIPGVKRALAPTRDLAFRSGGQWTMKRAVLIPSYVFVLCEMNSAIYHRIREDRDALGWLGKDGYWPEIVPEEQMQPVERMDALAPPESVLENVTIDRRKRRGYGEIRIAGTVQRVAFTPENLKQADDTRVDERPATENAE